MSHWSNYKETIKAQFPELDDCLNPGAAAEEIAQLEQKIGTELPPQLKAVYLENNGEDMDAPFGMIGGFFLYTLDDIYDNWECWKELDDGMDDAERADRNRDMGSLPEGCIKKQYINQKWIPFCDDGGGNHIGVDLDPDTGGKYGQVISFGRDEKQKIVIADDFNAFLERMCRIVNSDQFSAEDGYFMLGDSEHFIDYLKSGDAIQ